MLLVGLDQLPYWCDLVASYFTTIRVIINISKVIIMEKINETIMTVWNLGGCNKPHCDIKRTIYIEA